MKTDPYRLGMALLLVFTFGRIHQQFDFLAAVSPALLVTGLAVAYAVLNPQAVRTKGILSSWPARVILALLLFSLISAPFGLSLGGSADFIFTVFGKVVLTAFLLIMAVRSPGDLSTLIWAYVISAGIITVRGLFTSLHRLEGSRAASLSNLPMYDPNDISCILLVGLPLAILLFRASDGWKKLLPAIIIVGIGATVARSGSRGAFVGLLGVGLALLLMLENLSWFKRLAFLGVVAVGLFAAAPAGYWEEMATLRQPTDDYNWTHPYGRRALTERGIGYMVENPFFGVGIGNFERAEGRISERAQRYRNMSGPATPPVRWVSPHNSYVEAGAELGVPGLLLWCMLMFGCPVWLIRLRKRLPDTWRRAEGSERFLYEACIYLPAAFVAFAITSAFVSFAFLDPLYVLTAFAVGTHFLVRDRLDRKPQPSAAGERALRQGESPYRRSWARR